MSYTRRMLDSHPQGVRGGEEVAKALVDAIDALLACAQACSACADACLGEDDPAALRLCIRSDLDCADVCTATARILSRRTALEVELVRSLLDLCVATCRTCAEECARHGDHEHCAVCAEACRACADACGRLADQLATMEG